MCQRIGNAWYLCTSVFSEIELIPEMEPVQRTLKRLTFEDHESELSFLLPGVLVGGVFATAIHLSREFFHAEWFKIVSWYLEVMWLFGALVCFFGVLCFVAGCSYRTCLKSTALLWLPLLYIVRITFDEALRYTPSCERFAFRLFGASFVCLPGQRFFFSA